MSNQFIKICVELKTLLDMYIKIYHEKHLDKVDYLCTSDHEKKEKKTMPVYGVLNPCR